MKSVMSAAVMAMLVSSAMMELTPKLDCAKTMNPATRMMVVTRMATPTFSKV